MRNARLRLHKMHAMGDMGEDELRLCDSLLYQSQSVTRSTRRHETVRKEPVKSEDQPRKVYNFLKENANTPYCDDCLEKKTGIGRNHLNTITLTLSILTREFSRRQGVCHTATAHATNCSRWQ
jgi:hypothetical protein